MRSLLLAAQKKFWILDPLYVAFGTTLAWFYAVIPSFGVAIMLLTVTVSILRMPLVAKQVKSQQEMQRIQPELKRIQAKYKNEPQKRNEEMMKLYKEHSVNPFAGCLPLVLQMPLFIVLYRVILNLGRPEPKHIPRTSNLFHAVQTAGGKMQSFGMDLAQAASKVNGFPKVLPYLVLIALVITTGLFQQRQMSSRLPKDAQNNQMAMMGKIFPAFLGLISWNIPAGVVLYFFVSNLWQIGQQAVLFRRQEARKAAAAGAPPDKDVKPTRTPKEDVPADGEGTAKGTRPEGKAKATGPAGKAKGTGPARKAPAGKRPAAKPARAKPAAGSAKAKPRLGAKQDGGRAKAVGRGFLGIRGNGKATGRDAAKGGRKADRRPVGGKDPSAGSDNGRGAPGPGGKGRAQPKGTNPQGRSRPARGNSRKGK